MNGFADDLATLIAVALIASFVWDVFRKFRARVEPRPLVGSARSTAGEGHLPGPSPLPRHMFPKDWQ